MLDVIAATAATIKTSRIGFVPLENANRIYASVGGLGIIGMFAKITNDSTPIKLPLPMWSLKKEKNGILGATLSEKKLKILSCVVGVILDWTKNATIRKSTAITASLIRFTLIN